MLVLSRKCEQSLLIGDNIVVTVLSVDGDRVKLGVDAPRSVAILRHEIFEQVRSANTTAATDTASDNLHSIAAVLRGRSPRPEVSLS
jgi:carbon storage regulator CsrA